MQSGTSLGEQIRRLVESGQLVPDEVVHKVVVEALAGLGNVAGVLLDGYPRTVIQAKALDRQLTISSKLLVLHLDVPEEEIKARIRLRGQSSGRADDQNEDKIQRRLTIYAKETTPVLAHYRNAGNLHTIHAVGEVDPIFSNLCKEVDKLLQA